MRQTGLLSILVCASSGYLLYLDRQSPLALDLVEVQSMVGIPIPAIFGFLGVGLVLWSLTHTKQTPPTRSSAYTPRTRTQPTPTTPNHTTTTKEQPPPTGNWWGQVRSSCNQITLPPGARITLEYDKPCPVYLYLEMAPSERCKRAIRSVAEWFATFSTPPRLRIEFDHCPEGPTPRHHMVNGALATHLDRGSFKVVTDRDAVEVLFHRPDPRWNIPQNIG